MTIGVRDWAAVFPELVDHADTQRSEEAIEGVLAAADSASDGLGPWLEATPPARATQSTGLSNLPFADFLEQQVADLCNKTAEELAELALVEANGPWKQKLLALTVEISAAFHLRPLLSLLAQRRDAGALVGATSEERYDDFARWLASDAGRSAYAHDYPDLVARARATAAMTLSHIAADLRRTDSQWFRICAAFDLATDSRVDDVRFAGDPHGMGRRVMILHTDHGDEVVLKPRGVTMERGYAQFSYWLGAQVGVTMPLLRCLTSSAPEAPHLGWVEHIGAKTGEKIEAHDEYFSMLGLHLAALVLLNGTDIHFENLLTDASGRPVVVDAEALFTPTLLGDCSRPLHGVTETGLVSITLEGGSVDFGAIGYRPGALSPFRAWQLTNLGRDDLRLEMQRVRVEDAPAMAPGAHLTEQTLGQLRAVFGATMTWARQHPDRVVGAIDDHFPDDPPVRYIHRPTMAYAMVARLASHPMFATDIDRKRALGRLAVLAPKDTAESMLRSELSQLMAGDIPSFQVSLGGLLVCDGSSGRPVAQLLASPKEQTRGGIRSLTPADVARELDVLDTTLGNWLLADRRS